MGLYRSLENAIRLRFERYAPVQRNRFPTTTAEGGAALQGTGSNMPTRDLLNKPTTLKTILGGRSKRVPVFYEDKGGQDASIWPAISFRMDSEEPRETDWRQEDALTRCVGMAQQYNLRSGEETSGPDLIETIPSPDPVTLTYEIRVWSLNHEEAQELLEVVKQLFPLRGFIEVTYNDGTTGTYDMLRTDGPTWVGGVDPTLNTGDEGDRFYSWSILYDIEAYEDNTLLTELGPTIRKRTLEYSSGTDPADDDGVIVVDLDGSGPAPPDC